MSYADLPKPWYKRFTFYVILLISLIGIAMAALLILIAPRPEEIMKLMQWRMVNAKSFRVETDVSWKGDVVRTTGPAGAGTTVPESVELVTGGIYDGFDEDLPKHRHEFEFTMGVASPQTFGGEYRRIGKRDFVNFDTAPGQLGTFQLTPFRDNWLLLEPQKILSRIDSPFVPKTWERLDELDEAYLLEQFRITPFLTVTEKLDPEMVRGAETYHFLVRPEMILVKDYFMIAQEVRFGRELTKVEQRQINDFFADVSPEYGELWIGKGSYYLHRLKMRFRYNDGVRKGTLEFTLDFSDFNERFKIDPPTEEVQDIEPIISSLLPTVLPNLPLSTGDAGIGDRIVVDGSGGRTYLGGDGSEKVDDDPDGDGLSTQLEHFYGTDPNDPDTDRDGVNDGDEVAQSRNPNGPGKLYDFGISDALQGNSAQDEGADEGLPSEEPSTEEGLTP